VTCHHPIIFMVVIRDFSQERSILSHMLEKFQSYRRISNLAFISHVPGLVKALYPSLQILRDAFIAGSELVLKLTDVNMIRWN
jgi:hypothetical protein